MAQRFTGSRGAIGSSLVTLLLALAVTFVVAATDSAEAGQRAAPVRQPVVAVPRIPGHFRSEASTSRFLAMASFGPRREDIEDWTGGSAATWFLEQLEEPPTFMSPQTEDYFEYLDEDSFLPFSPNSMGFWRHAAYAPDQLRQRMAYALSQILVVSDFGGELLTDYPSAMAYYIDLLAEHALGNYRDLLEAITYSPAMGYYLTYLGNLPADPATGRMPDENYAREILQLFTIGLVELERDGSPRTDAEGNALETYSNDDVTGLARVFTGLDLDFRDGFENADEDDFSAELARPMVLRNAYHSMREKCFLGTCIPAGTAGDESIRLALDHIMSQTNVGPFLGRQLIQRFTTSDPSPAYVAHVARAFNRGYYRLPDGTGVGEGRKGDLSATIAAVLFAPHARMRYVDRSPRFGKLREPVLRFTQWVRAFNVNADSPELSPLLYDTLSGAALAQHPFRARSVFNFYRPGYIAPGTRSGEAGMTVPELQILNASSAPGYVNFMTYFVFAVGTEGDALEELEEVFDEAGIDFDPDEALYSFAPDYEAEMALAHRPRELVATLDLLLANGALTAATEAAIAEAIAIIPLDDFGDFDGRWLRAAFAILMTMTAPDYLVQR